MNPPPSRQDEILTALCALGPMALGSLTPVFRGDSTTPRYFKLQLWKDGKNHTRHVKAEELPELRARVEARITGERLFAEFIHLRTQAVDAREHVSKKKRK
jgi:hypothetical protein